ncbi:MAG: DUF4430 domain-containing protein [Candidatus Doudnabacteria bacterium]|nr:DUF4430 domain-containing protein [Candidatus Doudnabacteria bacterium]
MPLLRPQSSKRFAVPQPWVQVVLVLSVLILIALLVGAYRIRVGSSDHSAALVETLSVEEAARGPEDVRVGHKHENEQVEPMAVSSLTVVELEPEAKATRSSHSVSPVNEGSGVVSNDVGSVDSLESFGAPASGTTSPEPGEQSTPLETERITEGNAISSETPTPEPEPTETPAPRKDTAPKETPASPAPKEEKQEISVRLTISGPGGGAYTVTTTQGTTVESVMRSATGLVFVTKPFAGMGSFVESINGVANNEAAGLYWTFYLNGAFASRGISAQTVNDGDQIEWRYQSSPL